MRTFNVLAVGSYVNGQLSLLPMLMPWLNDKSYREKIAQDPCKKKRCKPRYVRGAAIINTAQYLASQVADFETLLTTLSCLGYI